MNSLMLRKEYFLASLVAIYCACHLITSLNLAWEFTTDDAYISWLYARQLIQGHGLYWHTALPVVEGYSNFLWVMIAALVIILKLSLLTTVKGISCFCLGAGLIFLYRLSRLFLSPLLAILPVFIFSHYIGTIWWTVSGLESALYCALSLLYLWQCMVALGYKPIKSKQMNARSSDYSMRAWIVANTSLFLLCLTRFEGLIWIVPGVFFIGCEWRTRALKQWVINEKPFHGWAMISLFCFIIPYLVYFIWRLHYFGHWIPNSYSCKNMASDQLFVIDFDYLQLMFPLLMASLPYFLSKKDCRHVLFWMPSVLYGLMLWNADSVVAYFIRLFLAPFALFSVLAVLGIDQLSHYFDTPKWSSKLFTTVIIISVTLVFIPGSNAEYLKNLVNRYHEKSQNRQQIAQILTAQAQNGDKVLINDCGLIPFMTSKDVRFIDTECLNNTELNKVPYKDNVSLYADLLMTDVKPQWAVISSYPPLFHLNELSMQLQRKHFFKDYQLIITLKSGGDESNPSQSPQRVIDSVYQVYKRKT